MGPNNWGEVEFVKRRRTEKQYLTLQEATEGNLRFFNMCQLKYDKNGRKYRTNIPRVMPVSKNFEFRNRSKKDGKVY